MKTKPYFSLMAAGAAALLITACGGEKTEPTAATPVAEGNVPTIVLSETTPARVVAPPTRESAEPTSLTATSAPNDETTTPTVNPAPETSASMAMAPPTDVRAAVTPAPNGTVSTPMLTVTSHAGASAPMPDITALEPRAEFEAISAEIAGLDIITRARLEPGEAERLRQLSEVAESRIATIEGIEQYRADRARVFLQIMRENIDAALKTDNPKDFAARVNNIQNMMTALKNLMKNQVTPH